MLHPTLTSRIAHSQVFGISIFVLRTFAHARLQELRKGGEGSMINDEVPLAADKRLLGNSDSRGSPMLTQSLELMVAAPELLSLACGTSRLSNFAH